MKVRSPMFVRRNSLRGAIALCIGSMIASPLLLAQEDALEEVVITGSRLQRSNMNAAQPVSTISAQDLNNSPSVDVAEVLNDNPTLLSSVTSNNSLDSEPNNVGSADNVGGSALNLRGLGYNRTLTLVNGRRHVAGIEGTSSVDVSTIPSALIERVEVLTGGASAVYGADAVTGVVNFVLKENFEGAEANFRTGLSAEGDAETNSASFLFGQNFADNKGNVVLGVQYDYSAGLREGARDHTANNALWNDDVNPALRFQKGDIDPATMPNLARFFSFENTGRYPYGLRIPTTSAFNTSFSRAFGAAPTLTAAEEALLARPAASAPRAFLPGRVFSITGAEGIVAIGDFGSAQTPLGSEPDLDGNGTPDCLDSFTGYNSSLDGAASFGAAGGCWVLQDGKPVPYKDGLIAGNFNQFGAEQSYIAPNRAFIIPRENKASINLNATYDLTPSHTLFAETKYVRHEVAFGGGGHQFFDLLYGAPDNPFLPAELAAFANNDGVDFVGPGGLYLTRDPDDWGPNVAKNERDTMRFVAGLRGDIGDTGFTYELSANYGKFERTMKRPEEMITDRFFAAIDVVTDPATGQAVCRSDLDPTAYPRTTPFDIPTYVGEGAPSPFLTFTPGDGSCKPANIWGGRGSVSQEALDFMTYTRTVQDEIEQTVFSGFVSGDSEAWFSLPAGPISFAVGGEWREEQSAQTFDAYDRGVIQVAGVTADGIVHKPGDLSSALGITAALGGDPSTALANSSASYDVWDMFAEVEVPLLAGLPFAEELTLETAVRRADYSTFGTNTTYKVGGVWEPLSGYRVRANLSEAVRVPNLFELYSPQQGARFRPADPCDVAQISSAADPALRQANCVQNLQALGVPADKLFDGSGNYAFVDPLSAGFPGVIGGNANLQPEEATTKTVGFVIQPDFLQDLTLTVDYWQIEIDQAISEISAQNIVDSCYDSPSINNPFCELIGRVDNPSSAQAGGLNFLRQVQLNFGAAVTEGVDFTAGYSFDVGPYTLGLVAGGTKVNKLEFIEPTNPGEPPSIDNELGEARRPEWSGQVTANFMYEDLSLSWTTQYLGEQLLGYEDGAEIETAMQNFGPAAFTDEFYTHNLNGSYLFSDQMTVFGGINNVTDEQPFRTEYAYPVSPVGRAFYLGLNYQF